MKNRMIYLVAAMAVLTYLLYTSASDGQEYEFVFSRPEKILGLRHPKGIAVDGSGNVYVTGRWRIQKFRPVNEMSYYSMKLQIYLRSAFASVLTALGIHLTSGEHSVSEYASYTPEQVFMEFQELAVSGDIGKAKSLTAVPLMRYWEEKDQLSIRYAPFNLTIADVKKSDRKAKLTVEGMIYDVAYPSTSKYGGYLCLLQESYVITSR